MEGNIAVLYFQNGSSCSCFSLWSGKDSSFFVVLVSLNLTVSFHIGYLAFVLRFHLLASLILAMPVDALDFA